MASNRNNIDMEHVRWEDDPPKGYALSGKIMLSAIVILFAVVVFMVVLHLYARWYILRERQRQLLRRRRRFNRRSNLVFYVDNPTAATTSVIAANLGLDASVLNSLPIFVYSSNTHPEVLECAVCLSEFEENEEGRLLPKCNHSFHIECIDMWFQSHSTCPLCRSLVEPVVSPQNYPSDVVLSVGEPEETEPGSSSGLCSTCQHVEEHSTSPSLGARRKGLDLTGIRVEVSRRNEFEDELRLSSPIGGFRSPGTRLLSLRRIISMNRKSSGVGTSRGSVDSELDIERGMGESTQPQTRAQTPR